MAQVSPISRVLQLQFQVGTTADGRPKLQNRNYSHVSVAAADDDVLAVGQALAGLCADPLFQVTRIDATGLALTQAATTTP